MYIIPDRSIVLIVQTSNDNMFCGFEVYVELKCILTIIQKDGES